MEKTDLIIEDSDFMFKNSLVNVVANRNSPEINLAGFTIEDFKEGREYKLPFWVAKKLEKSGVVRTRLDELLSVSEIHKIHWKERVQSVRQVSPLPSEFYPKLRNFLVELREQIKDPEKLQEYEKIASLSRDIVNCRLKKIVSLASAPAQTDQILSNLTVEERVLYNFLYEIISGWRNKILKVGAES